ncbi:MAG TPA: hypothetical protein VLG11_01025 [Candidatus Saccharimonadales bacterium]|nr:hypothetical protein [Candidatus Saccharimonadales bacterium]
MSAPGPESNLPLTFDPDHLPSINVCADRHEQPDIWTMREGDADKGACIRLQRYYIANRSSLAENHLKVSNPYPPHNNALSKREQPDAFTVIPTGVEQESVESIVPTLESIKSAAANLNGPLLLLPWLNFQADMRRGNPSQLFSKAYKMAGAILDIYPPGSSDHNVEVQVGIDHMPAGSTISRARNNAAQAGFAALWPRYAAQPEVAETLEANWQHKILNLHNLPFYEIDADTVIGEDFFTKSNTVFEHDKAVFTNGRVRYAGPIMDLAPAEFQTRGEHARFIYITETLRRLMFEHLPPTTHRGYTPETGWGKKFGAPFTLGGFEVRSHQNESFFMEMAARSAWDGWYDTSTYKPMPRGACPNFTMTDPYLNYNIAARIESMVRYVDTRVDTSIGGIVKTVNERGPLALIAFDQGDDYTMRTAEARPAVPEVDLSIPERRLLLDSIYSYFKDCNGELLAEDINHFNETLAQVLGPFQENLFWAPTYINKEDRPKPPKAA